MAIDRVSLWRNSPSHEIAFDNELFLEAQQSQFLLKDIDLSTTLAELMAIRIVRPSIVIGSLEFSNNATTKTIKFAGLPGPMAGFSCNYTGYDSGNTAASTDIVDFTTTITAGTQRVLLFAKVSPHVSLAYKDMFLYVSTSATPGTLRAGSFLKIL